MLSTPGIRSDLFKRPIDRVRLMDFFGNVQRVLPLKSAISISLNVSPTSILSSDLVASKETVPESPIYYFESTVSSSPIENPRILIGDSFSNDNASGGEAAFWLVLLAFAVYILFLLKLKQ